MMRTPPWGGRHSSATIPSNQVGKLGIRVGGGGMAMGMLDRTGQSLPLPLLTSRRHIDLGRTSSAICRPSDSTELTPPEPALTPPNQR
ncbi:putative leader peptide [Streptomyces blattellae]|uniref:putative leader peptide n=1 Tax=Streptomyces blattellae TaxID=2569855 RepID=UPI0038B4FD4D